MIGVENWTGIWILAALWAAAGTVYFWRRGKEPLTSLVLKMLVIALLSLVISKPFWEKKTTRSDVLLLVDVSDSMDSAVGDSLLKEARALQSAGTHIEVFPFAGTAGTTGVRLEDVGSFRKLQDTFGKLNVGATNLEEALKKNAYPGAQALLLSDGFENQGDSMRLIPELRSSHIQLFPLLNEDSATQEATPRISQLYTPLVAPTSKSVDIRVSIDNPTEAPQSGTLKVQHGEKIISEKKVELAPGKELLEILPSDPNEEGIKEVTATFTPDKASFAPSSSTSYISSQERPRVLLVTSAAEEEKLLKETLADQSFRLEAITSNGQKLSSLPQFDPFSLVIFNNISFPELPNGVPATLERYVKGGGGFLMVGGNKSFGLGQYRSTSVEDILPVRSVPPQTVAKRLNVAVALVIDKSGSMLQQNKMGYLKEAAREVVKSLKDDDYLSIIGFDDYPWVALEMTTLRDGREKARGRIDLLFPKGGTRPLQALDQAQAQLRKAKAGRKHMIVLTDGRIPDGYDNRAYYLALVQDLRVEGVTVSTFMLGSEQENLLEDMAERGGGAFHRTTDAQSLPRLFLNDIKVSTGERTQKESNLFDVLEGDGEIISTDLKSFPPLLGYVQTEKKQGANVELVTFADRKSDPLLASWDYGKGRALAYTSDASGRWSAHWARWGQFSKFWSDIVEAGMGGSGQTEAVRFELRPFMNRGTLTLDLSIFSEHKAEGLGVVLTTPTGATSTLTFDTLSRGHYQAQFDKPVAGKYQAQLSIGGKSLTPVAFHISGENFGEKKGQGFNRPHLEFLASQTSGKVNPRAEHLQATRYEVSEKTPLDRYLLGLAIFFMLIDILAREVFRYRLPRFLKLRKSAI